MKEILHATLRKSNLFHLLAIVLLPATMTGMAQDAAPFTDLKIEDLMNVKIESVFGASKFLQKVIEAPAAVSVVTRNG